MNVSSFTLSMNRQQIANVVSRISTAGLAVFADREAYCYNIPAKKKRQRDCDYSKIELQFRRIGFSLGVPTTCAHDRRFFFSGGRGGGGGGGGREGAMGMLVVSLRGEN